MELTKTHHDILRHLDDGRSEAFIKRALGYTRDSDFIEALRVVNAHREIQEIIKVAKKPKPQKPRQIKKKPAPKQKAKGQHGGDRYANGYATEAEKTKIADLWNKGLSAAEIAKRMSKRSRNAVIGIVTRMRDKGDSRIIRGALRSTPFSDAESLKLLSMRENEGATFRDIGDSLGRPGPACSAHYAEIIRDMKQAGMI